MGDTMSHNTDAEPSLAQVVGLRAGAPHRSYRFPVISMTAPDWPRKLKELSPKLVLLLGPEPWQQLGYQGKFLEHRGTVVEPRAPLPKCYVMPTVDPESRASWIREGFETYHADLMKAARIATCGLEVRPEHFTLGPDAYAIIKWLGAIPKGAIVAIDIETDGISRDADVVCIGIASSPSDACVIPWRIAHGKSWFQASDEKAIAEALQDLYASHPTVWHFGVRFDIPFLIRKGLGPKPDAVIHDTWITHSELSPSAPHSLAYLASLYSMRPCWKDVFKHRPGSIYEMNPTQLWTYNARDACATLEVFEAMPKSEANVAAWLYIKEALYELDFDRGGWESFIINERIKVRGDLLRLGNLPKNFNLDSSVHLNAFIFGLKSTATAAKLVAKNRERIEKLVAKGRKVPKNYTEAQATLAFMEAITPLADVSKLGLTFRVGNNGLYSFDALTRERILVKAAARIEKLKAAKRSKEAAEAEAKGLSRLIDWIALYDYHMSLSGDPHDGGIDTLYAASRFIKPRLGGFKAYATTTAWTIENLRFLAGHRGEPVMFKKDIIVFDCAGGVPTVGEALKGATYV